MIQTAIIPTWTNDRPEVHPTKGSVWMLPFVTPGYRSNSLAPVNPSITPILNTIPDSVEMWWRWERLTVEIFSIYEGFGARSFEVFRRMHGSEELILEEKQLAKKEAFLFKGGLSASIGDNTLSITAEILILPEKNTPIGNDITGEFFVDESYGLQEGQTPETCDCLPRIVITISVGVDAGAEIVNYLNNYGVADESFGATFNGDSITLNNANSGNSVFESAGPIIATITPSKWFSWNGTWSTTTGERI